MDKHPNDFEFQHELRKHEKWLLDLGEGKLSAPAHLPNSNIAEIPPSMYVECREDVIEAVFDYF